MFMKKGVKFTKKSKKRINKFWKFWLVFGYQKSHGLKFFTIFESASQSI